MSEQEKLLPKSTGGDSPNDLHQEICQRYCDLAEKVDERISPVEHHRFGVAVTKLTRMAENTHPQPAIEGDVVERVAEAIAEEAMGRAWPDDFEEIDAFDEDQSDIREYAKAAIAAMQPAIEDGVVDTICDILSDAYITYCPGGTWRDTPHTPMEPEYIIENDSELAERIVAALQPAIDKAVAEERARCEGLCAIYFDIAVAAIGEDEVRRLRDKAMIAQAQKEIDECK